MERRRFYTPKEVLLHSMPEDCWFSYLGKVYDLTPLCAEYRGDILLQPLLASAGTDISHWFDSQTGDVRHYIDPETHCNVPYTPHGRFVHIAPPYPTTDWANDFGTPWWKNQKYFVGYLTKKPRLIRIINTLSLQQHEIEVCSEETMTEIMARYLPFNAHAASYAWKYNGEVLDMNKTLEENGIHEETQDIEDQYPPQIHLYYNDDLTEA